MKKNLKFYYLKISRPVLNSVIFKYNFVCVHKIGYPDIFSSISKPKYAENDVYCFENEKFERKKTLYLLIGKLCKDFFIKTNI